MNSQRVKVTSYFQSIFFKDPETVIAKLTATIVSQFGSIGAHSNGVLPKLWTRLYDHTCNVRIPLKTFFLGILRDSFLLLISLTIKLKAEKNRRNCRCSLNQRTPAKITLFIPRKTPRCGNRYISDKEKTEKRDAYETPSLPYFDASFKNGDNCFSSSQIYLSFFTSKNDENSMDKGKPLSTAHK